MNSEPFHLSVSEIGNTETHWQCKVMPPDCLHYCPASAGGWGIIRVGLLVPESVMLFVSPAGCGRHGAIAGIQLGFKEQLFFLHLSEMDIVTGQHMEKIPQAVTEILATARPQPKAMLICTSCIDDLLCSDYDGLAQQLEAEHKIPVRICRMDPIAMDGKLPPSLTVQQAIYDFLVAYEILKFGGSKNLESKISGEARFLEQSTGRKHAINIIGNFAPIDAGSEFYDVMADAGIEVKHIAACASFEEFQQMSHSAYNILVRPEGRLAVQQMKSKLGIPYCSAPVTYSIEPIAETYRRLGEFLGVELRTERHHEKTMELIASHQHALGPLSIAVGSKANAGPFELARALTEYNFHVRYIFADVVLDFDLEHIEWLKHHNPDIKVFTNVHPTMVNFLDLELKVDLAVGFDAGYFCPGAKTVPLTLDSQPYGYSGVITLFREMQKALENPKSHREQMYASGMVI